jgi:hypothetical protein
MLFDFDTYLNLLKSFSKDRLNEQDTPPAAGGSTTSAPSTPSPPAGYPTVTKWETGLTRGKANQIGNTKWESGRTLGKTYMNDPHYQWTSGRQMGSTGGSDY